ncbi:MAG: 1-acyl-sn-glycerol-3-phosphate acyltransferase [Gemmatimonadetes bacterium]|nr:1-acyl-sn-glycerol-3-phosphate acyltransferase [Gemmatimonadota bacterium]
MIRTLWVGLAAVVLTIWYGTPILFSRALRLDSLPDRCWDNPRRWARAILRAAGVRVELDGVEHLGEDSAQVLVANHESWFDVLALAGYLPVDYRFVAKKELARVPVFGPAWRACGHIAIDRRDQQAAIEALERARREVHDRPLTIVMYPEGTRTPDGELLPFKKGAFVLAIQVGVPVVPAGIVGARAVMPKGSFRIRPGTLRIRIGEPLQTEGLVMKDRDALTLRARDAVKALRRPLPSDAVKRP